MTPDRQSLEKMSREALIGLAREAGVKRADVLTRMELCDEILRASVKNPVERKRARGWLGVARDLLASVVEQGLNLPEAAAMIRGEHLFESQPRDVAPIATVTLAEIYTAQGHPERALEMLDKVLEKEPEHAVARRLRTELVAARAPTEAARPTAIAPDTAEPEPDTLEPAAPGDDAPPPAARSAAFPHDDALVTLRTGPNRWYVYWERRDGSALGAPRIRLVSTAPGPGGTVREEQFLEAAPTVGGRHVSVSSSLAIVRAALVVDDRGRARARAVAVDGRLGESGVELVWSPRRRLAAAPLLDRAAAHFRSRAS